MVSTAAMADAKVSTAGSGSAAEQTCELGAHTRATIGTYEWRRGAWSTQDALAELVAAAEAVCLDRIYVDLTGAATASTFESTELAAQLHALVDVAARSGIEVGAVAGDAWWPSAQGRLDTAALLSFVARQRAAGLQIVSLHLDVEPWGLDEWASDKVALLGEYLDYVDDVERLRREVDPSLPVSYLIPYWFDGSNGEAPDVSHGGRTAAPFAHLTDILDAGSALVIMAYRNTAEGPNGIYALAADEARDGSVPIQLAVETAPIEPASATFAGSCLARLDVETRSAANRLGVGELVINDAPSLFALGVSPTVEGC